MCDRQRVEQAPRQHYVVTLTALIAVGLAFALFMTLVLPALPLLQREFGTTPEWSTWIVTVYLLTAAVMTPLLGKLGDQYGKGRLLKVSLVLFLVGLVGAALAWNIASLIAFRAVQGAAGAIFPLSFGIIRDEFPPERVGLGMGSVSAVWGVGGAAGFVVAGPLIDAVSWRGLFAVAAVAIAGALVFVHRYVPESPVRAPARLDLPGAALLSGALVCLLLALTEGEPWGWGSPAILGLFAAAAGLLLAWVKVERRVPVPLVDLTMYSRRPLAIANGVGFLSGLTMIPSFVLIPSFVQASGVGYGFGASVTQTGIYYFMPGELLMLAIGPLAGWFAGRHAHAAKWPLTFGLALASAAAASLALFHDRPWQFIVGNTLFSAGLGFAFASLPKLVSDSVRPTEMGVANGMNVVVRSIGGVIGGQAAAAILVASGDVPSESGYVAGFWLITAAASVGAALAVLATSGRRVGSISPVAESA